VNCREAAREATLGCPLTREAKDGGRAGIAVGFTARNVGATLAVARETGERFFAALRMTGTGGRPAGERAEQSPAPTALTEVREADRRGVEDAAPYGV
jgi:hypothetical protein